MCEKKTMITKARVIFTRSRTGMAAAQTSTGAITVFEMLGNGKVARGDILSGNLEQPCGQEIYNETHDEELSVFIHECGMDVQKAVEKYFAQLPFAISGK